QISQSRSSLKQGISGHTPKKENQGPHTQDRDAGDQNAARSVQNLLGSSCGSVRREIRDATP
ncbi:hypothetical protein, partial [Aquisphaera insulae]|uniref:hypothetical protein n=1 Tax=Aquisphaera insulae TaxID=2712864 RepID=UPI00196AFAB7